MRANLAEREVIYGELMPWDSPNCGMDEYWAHCYPYEQDAVTGENVTLHVDIRNHSSVEREAVCCPVLPKSWDVNIEAKSAMIKPKNDGRISFTFTVPNGIETGKVIVPIELTYDNRDLGQFREAMLNIKVKE